MGAVTIVDPCCGDCGGGGGGGGGTVTPVEDSSSDGTIVGTINGVNTVFSLSAIPLAESLSLFVNGVRQTVILHYTRAGATITFGDAPQVGDIIDATYLV